MDEQDNESTMNQLSDFHARLGLEADPFPAETDTSFYYENPELMQRLDMIQHLIGFSNQMIFVTGEDGVGKTSMLERLEYYAPDHWRICRIQANPMLNIPILLRQLASGFELDIAAEADDLFQVYSDALQDHIATLERAMLTPVVLIDDAHELPIDAFTMLFGFMQQEGGNSCMKMALFCESQIITMLDSPQLKSLSQNLTHQLEIPSFDEEQTREYLEKRLHHAGLSSDFPFHTETVHKIYQDSQGIAGKIHIYAQQALLNEDSQTLPVVDEILDVEEEIDEDFSVISTVRENLKNEAPMGRKFHSWQIGAVAAVLALLAGVLWLTTQFGDSPESSIAEEIPLDLVPEQTTEQDPSLFDESTPPVQTMEVDPDVAVPDDGEEVLVDLDMNTSEEISDPLDILAEEEKNIDPLDEFVQSLEDQGQQDSVDVDQQHDEVTDQVDENGNSQMVEISKPEPVIVEEVTASVEQNIEPIAEPQATIVQNVEVNIPAPVEQLPTGTSIEPEVIQNSPQANVKDGAWLRSQKDTDVVLQILGTHDRQALTKILSENELGNDVAWFTTVHAGEPWYVVVKGPFQDRASATASISSLPAVIKARKPWPRTIASVKKAMDEAP